MSDARRHPGRPAGKHGTTAPRTLAALVRALNDPGRGSLLDALVEITARIADATPRDWHAETLAALVEGWLERLTALGVRPIRRPGEILSLTHAQLAGRYQYHGTPFRPGERRKRVVVAAPGWIVGRRTVVRPVVREAPPDGRP